MTWPPSSPLPASARDDLAARFALDGAALGLLGSHARGEAGAYSDVDLLLLVPEGAPPPVASSHLVDGRLVVVSPASAAEAAAWFARPELVVQHVGGLRHLEVLRDPAGKLAALRDRARTFRWTPELERRADRWVGDALVGWAEEALRGLEGLERDDAGRMLLARFGLTWGLSRLMLIHERLLPASERLMLDALAEALGEGSRWIALQRAAFGLAPVRPASQAPTEAPTGAPTLRDQVEAGLALYVETAKRVDRVLQPQERAVVEAVVTRIGAFLGR